MPLLAASRQLAGNAVLTTLALLAGLDRRRR